MLGETISHYRILEKLGQGGMGEVYLAEDTRLGRRVALKFLAPELARDREALIRFRIEARAAAELSHPNIATIHDFDEADGKPFLVLEYLDGQTLGERCAQGPLPIEDVIRIGKSLAAGLSEAHSHGIVHRDIKSANVMLTGKGQVKILDFGLAHRADATQITREGTTLGTIAYMSPEQARGEIADARSDLWSVGVVLYECLTGKLPFVGPSGAVIEQIQVTEPSPPSALRSKVPLSLEQVVLRCMEKDPTMRTSSAQDLAAQLRAAERAASGARSIVPANESSHSLRSRFLWAAAIILVITVIGASAWRWIGQDPVAQLPPAILVTPLDVLGQSEGAEYLGRSVAEAIAVNLTTMSSLHVLPVPTAPEFNPDSVQNTDAARRAQTLFHLGGSLVREDSVMTLSLSLVDLNETRLVWGVNLTLASDGISRTAVDVAREIIDDLGSEPRRQYAYFRHVRPSPVMAGWPGLPELVTALREHDVAVSVPMTRDLVDAFPHEYAAHVMRLVALNDNRAINPSDEGRAALRDARDAVERIDPEAPIVAIARAWDTSDLDEKVAILTPLLERDDLSPSCRSHVLRTRGRALSVLGRNEEGFRDLDEALRLDPANPWNYAYSAHALQQAGRPEEALARMKQHAALDPIWGTYLVAEHYAKFGDYEQALHYFEQALELGFRGTHWQQSSDFDSLRKDDRFQSLVRDYGMGSG